MKYARALIAILTITFTATAQNNNEINNSANGPVNVVSMTSAGSRPLTPVEKFNAEGVKKTLEEKNYEEATALFREAVKSDPSCSLCYYNLGMSLLNCGNADEAIKVFKEINDREPKFANGYSGLGDAYTKKGMFAESVSAYQRAAELAPTDDVIIANLGNALFQVKNFEASIVALDKAVKLNPKSARAKQPGKHAFRFGALQRVRGEPA